MDRLELRRVIETAFAGVRRDPEQSLHQAQLCDQGLTRPIHGLEWREAGERDRDDDWRDVPGEDLEACDAALSHFTVESWRFYLPAYLCLAIDSFVDPDWDEELGEPDWDEELVERVIWQLDCVDFRGEESAYLRGRFDSLDDTQAAAVRSVLEWFEAESLRLIESTNDYWPTYHQAQKALVSYWARR